MNSDVPSQASVMSFSVRDEHSGLEYNGTSLNTLFAQRRNLLRPSFLRMIRDILRFNREAPALLDSDDDDIDSRRLSGRAALLARVHRALHRSHGRRHLVDRSGRRC